MYEDIEGTEEINITNSNRQGSGALKLPDVMCVVSHIIANYTTLFELIQYSSFTWSIM